MTEEINKFDALAYAVSRLGPPHKISEKRCCDRACGLVYVRHMWDQSLEQWLVVDEWSDGDQCTGGEAGAQTDLVWVRNNSDGSLCPEYEEQARALIDAYAEARAEVVG